MGDYKKTMEVISGVTVRDLVRKANSLGVQKEDIVSLIKSGELVVLIYYK